MSTPWFTAVVLGLAVSPTFCFPHHGGHLQDPRAAPQARAALPKRNMPSWEIPVICISMFVVFMAFGLIGGACEYLLCARRKRAAVHRDGSDLDLGCRGTPAVSPQIGSDQATLVGDRPASHGGVHAEEKLGRYSWQDDKGITTEVYLDGTVPGAGPPQTARGAMARLEQGGFGANPSTPGPTNRAPQDRRGNHLHLQPWGAGVVSPLSPEEPQFVIHDEQDDREYREEMQNHPGRLVGYYGPAPSPPTVSPVAPEATGGRSMPWQDERASPATRFEPWLPTVDLTIDDEPLDEITLADNDAAGGKPTARPSGEGKMWKTHPTQFL